MLTPTGAKLLDFGLAKPSPALAAGLTLTAAATQSAPVTAEGIIVGTFQYMSPEQIEGKVVDGRSDIFSLGSVLYEMLTGQRAFPGKSQLSVASAILEKEPAPIANVKPLTPPALDHTIRRCLAKDPEERWQTARDLQLELKWMAESGSQPIVSVPGIAPRKPHERLAWGSGAVLVLLASAFAIGFSFRTPKRGEPMRLSAELGAEANLIPTFGSSAILSPDGTHLAVIAMGSDQKRRIYVRSLDQLKAVVLSGTENSRNHFFSPDGQWLGFFADGKVKKISIHGGAAAVLCDAPDDRGGSWSEDGTIVFSPLSGAPLLKVSSSGGTPQPLTTLDIEAGELTHRWPQVLPGGKLFCSRPTPLQATMKTRTSSSIRLIRGSGRAYIVAVFTLATCPPVIWSTCTKAPSSVFASISKVWKSRVSPLQLSRTSSQMAPSAEHSFPFHKLEISCISRAAAWSRMSF
jgi:hypothetical protein